MSKAKISSGSGPTPKIELICVGTELLESHVNTHERYIGRRLREIGLSLSRGVTVPDDARALTRAVEESLSRCDALITCGGLGPTFDDLTREAVAAALGRKLVYKPALFREIERKLSRHRMSVPERNKRQAFLIEGGKVLANGVGSAPGQLLTRARRGKVPQTIVLLPGPYAELSPIFERQVLPRLRRTYARGLHACTAVFRLQGLPESVADERLACVTRAPEEGTTFTILAGSGQVDFHATVVAKSQARARARLGDIGRRVRAVVGEHVFGGQDDTLESALGAALLRKRWTLAVAESCTGGGIGQRLTETPGSSRYFLGGVIAYDNSLKTRLLGVSRATLSRHGAVSAACAKEMAAGARRAAKSTLGLGVTGVAGPGGGSTEKPVGLVYAALAGPGAEDVEVLELRLGRGRSIVRQRAVSGALGLALRRAVL